MPGLYHRFAKDPEIDLVVASGKLWGRSPRISAGGGPACAKAFVGDLPPDRKGYSFRTDTPPTRSRTFAGRDGVVWVEDCAGVFDVPGRPDYVGIKISLVRVERLAPAPDPEAT